MKNIIKSLVIVMAVSVVAGGATWAYFSDHAIVENNTFAAGTLNFTLNGDLTETKSLSLDGMAPGDWSGPYVMKVYNNQSTMPIKYRFQDKKDSSDPVGFYSKLNARVVHGYCNDTGVDYATYDETMKLSDMYFDSTADAISAILGVNITHCFELYFQLDPSAGNSLQGGNAQFDIVVDGTQENNPSWN